MKRTKKLLSLLLALALVLTIVPFSGISVSAYDAPLLNSDGYYEISTADHLYWFAEQVNSGNNAINGVLMNDIVVNEGDLSGYDGESENTWTVWTPIGTTSNHYTGIFDGNNYSISGLYFNDSTALYVGLFFYVSGTIKNLDITNSYFCGYGAVGSIACANVGSIVNCNNEGTVIGGTEMVGGIVSQAAGTIKDCENNGKIIGAGYVGGIVGYIEGAAIANCINNGSVKGANDVGGIVGYGYSGSVSECVNNGAIYGTETGAGGIIGKILGDGTVSILNCENNGRIVANEVFAGGICGSIMLGTAIIENNSNMGEIHAEQYSAGIIAEIYTDTDVVVKDCKNSGIINGNDLVAGIVADNNDGSVLNCKNSGEIVGYTIASDIGFDHSEAVSGVVAINTGIVSHCSNTADITSADVSGVAGIVALNSDGIVEECYNTGEIWGTDVVGGVIGQNSASVKSCYNAGSVYGETTVGGIVAENTSLDGIGVVTNCHNAGNVVGTDEVGGVVGQNHEGCTVEDCYYLKDADVSVGINGIGELYFTEGGAEYPEDAEGVTIEKTADEFASGEVAYLLNGLTPSEENIWKQNIGTDNYPKFNGSIVYKVFDCNNQPAYSNTNENIEHNYINGFCENCNGGEMAFWNDAENRYEISNVGQLYWFAEQVNSGNNAINGVLMNDIVVNENVLVEGELNTDEAIVSTFKEWTPIGTTSYYAGVFDGQNCKISGLYFNDSAASFVGLFGVSAGTIKNITVTDSYFHGDEGVAGIVAYSIGGTVENCCNESRIEGVQGIGGIIGASKGAVITNCKNTGDISGRSIVGGIFGLGQGATITNCNNSGIISAYAYLGGIAGSFVDGNGTYGEITNCYNSGDIITLVTEGSSYTGGIVGNGPAIATGCYNTGTVVGIDCVGGIAGYGASAIDCYNTGDVSGNDCVGGIAGANFYTVNGCQNYGVINAYGATYAGGIVGYNTGTIEDCENTGNINGKDWDSETDYAQNLGGIVGYNTGNVKGCYNTKGVSDGYIVGGVCGYNKATITDCYNSGYLSTPAGDAGGICGYNYNKGTIENCYNIGEVFAMSIAGGICSNANGTFVNCYYLAGCAENSMGITQNGIGSGEEAIEDIAGATTAKSADQFASGEVAYLLNNGVFDGTQAWYQNIDNGETVDASPKFDGGTVLKLSYGENKVAYSNACSHNFENGICSICGTGLTGIADNHFYKNGVMQKAYQLVEVDGDFYYIGDRHQIVKDKKVYIKEERLNGLTYQDGTPITAGTYTFDENGKMVILNGVVGDNIYKNNVQLKAYQLVEVDGDFYYIGDRHQIVKDKKIYIKEERLNGLTYQDGTPITAGTYTFDENGKMVILNGVVGDNIYKSNVQLKAYQLVEVDGDFYYIGDRHQIVKDKKVYIKEERLNGLTYPDGTPITAGYYNFDADGKMIIE